MKKIKKKKWNHKKKENKSNKNLKWQDKEINKLCYNLIRNSKKDNKKSKKEEFNMNNKKKYMLNNSE